MLRYPLESAGCHLIFVRSSSLSPSTAHCITRRLFLVTSSIFAQHSFSRRPLPSWALHREGLGCFIGPFVSGLTNIRFLGPSRLYNILLPPTNLSTLLRRRRAGGATGLVKIRPLGTPPLLIAQTQQLKNFTSRLTRRQCYEIYIAFPGSVTKQHWL